MDCIEIHAVNQIAYFTAEEHASTAKKEAIATATRLTELLAARRSFHSHTSFTDVG